MSDLLLELFSEEIPARMQAQAAADLTKLVTEAGIPADAAAIAMTLTQPGVNVATAVLQIEQLIKSGG